MNDFRLMIAKEELQKYGDQLLNFWQNEPASRLRNGWSDFIVIKIDVGA